MTNDEPKSTLPVSENGTFSDQVVPLVTNLLYPSESDEPVEPVSCPLSQTEPLTVSQIKEWLMQPPSVYVEERSEADFWDPVITNQDWYSDEEKKRTDTFQRLKQTLESQLSGRQVFWVGETEIDVYLIGLLATGERAGIKTRVVQT
ncbi:nuclease A inhibitor family protein [Spirosoma koreense]